MDIFKDLSIGNVGSSTLNGITFDYSSPNWSGISSEDDTLAERGKAIFANTSISASVVLGSITTNKLKLGNYGILFRLKSANNTLITDAIKIEIQKNISETYTTQKTYTLKASDFPTTTDYKCFLTRFEYSGARATNNQIKILITLLTQASAYKVDLDYIQITPTTIGSFE